MNDNLILQEPRPARADALKNHERLLEAARSLFETQGVEAVTMSAVAQAAGVGKGTLYRHFPSKLELCQALIDHDQRDLQDRTLARLREYDNARVNLEWFLGEVIDFLWRNLTLIPVNLDGDLLDHPAHRWWRQTIRGLLMRLQAQGALVLPDLDYAADALYLMIDPRTIAYQRAARGCTQQQVTEGILSLMQVLLRQAD